MRLGDLYPAAVAIVFIGLMLGLGVYVLGSLQPKLYTSTTVNVNNELGLFNQTRFHNLTAYTLRDVTCTINNITNATNTGLVIQSGNWTQNNCGINNITATFADKAWNICYTYTYNADSEASISVNKTIYGVDDFADWISIIVVVIAAAIVLGIVLSSFGNRRPGV